MERIGLVLAGGGARGAYEVGVLTELLPVLEARGQRPAVIAGTSVGAINAAFLGGVAHLGADEAMRRFRDGWLAITADRILRPIVGPSSGEVAARYLGDVLGVPGVDLHGILDPEPLIETLEDLVDWGALHRNVRRDVVDSVAVVATAARTARSVVFVEGHRDVHARSSHEIDYVGTRIGVDHVRASAAIPLLFPAIHLERPESARGWYFDGGTRLNTPLKPALDLGVDRVVVIATHPVDPRPDADWHTLGRQPDVGDAIVQLLFAVLVDSLIEDVRMLGKVNTLVRAARSARAPAAATDPPSDLGYREVPYIFVAPRGRDTIGDLAATIYARHFAGLRGVRAPDLALIARLLGGMTPPHAEVLSYLFFAPEFTRALIDLGREDARAWLARDWGPDGPWHREPVDELPSVRGAS